MPEESLIPINIVVADRSYRLRVKPEDEGAVRRVMKEVNSKIVEFKTSFAGKDMQDYISMCLIWYATQNTTGNETPEALSGLLQRMGEQMDEVLKETE